MGHRPSAVPGDRTRMCGKGTSNVDNDARNLSDSVGAARYEAMDASPENAYAHGLRVISAQSR